MTSDLTFQDSYIFAGSMDAVFDALWSQKDDTLLELRHISGTPRTVGHRQQVRVAFGGLDLLMIETVTAMTRPNHLRVEQLPDGFRRHDPLERDIPFLESLTEDLDSAFIAQFGNDPAATQIDFELADAGNETEVTITVQALTDQRLGWLRKRRWRKAISKEVSDIATRIAARI